MRRTWFNTNAVGKNTARFPQPAHGKRFRQCVPYGHSDLCALAYSDSRPRVLQGFSNLRKRRHFQADALATLGKPYAHTCFNFDEALPLGYPTGVLPIVAGRDEGQFTNV